MNQKITLDTYLAVYLDMEKYEERKEESFEQINEQSSQSYKIYQKLDKCEPEENDVQVEQVNNSSAFSEKTHFENNQSEYKAQVNIVNSEKEQMIKMFKEHIKRKFNLDEVSFQNKIQQIQQKSNSINQQNPELDKQTIQISEIQNNKSEYSQNQYSILQDLQLESNSQVKQQQLQEKYRVEFKKQQIESLCFSQDDTLIAVSDQNLIKIFKFEEGKMTQIDKLKGPLPKINCLEFIKKQNILFSGGEPEKDCSICMYQQSNNNIWTLQTCQQKSPITCMITNQEKTILYTGNQHGGVAKWDIKPGKNIKFISEKQEVHKNTVYGISLNASQTKMITCSKQEKEKKEKAGGKLIVWGGVQGNNSLIEIANIDLENYGCRILYTGEEEILFQQQYNGLLQFIVKDGKKQNEKLIFKTQPSPDHYLFPMQYNEKQNVGVCKQGDIVYLFRKNKNNDFELFKESDKQNNIKINGTSSTNGKWIVIQNQNYLISYQI